MEIEVKPKLDRSYVRRMLEYVISAGTSKIEDEKFAQFLKDAEVAFLEDMQHVAEGAFNKGREYERRQSDSKEA